MPAFIGLLIFFHLTVPANLSGADDAYTFARLLRDNSLSTLFLPRYALFLPISRIGYGLLSMAGLNPDAHTYLVWQSIICGSLAVLLIHYFSRNCLKHSRYLSISLALMLLFSWAFWRYSVEAELYTMSMMLLLVYIISIYNLRETSQITLRQLVIPVATGLLLILLYKPNALPVLVCLPLLAGRNPGFRKPLLLSGITFLLLLFSFLLLGFLSPQYGFSDFMFGGTSITPGKLINSFMLIISNLVSFLWIFSVPGADVWTMKIWPNKVLTEEIYLQKALAVPSWVLLLLILLLGLLIFDSLIRNRKELVRLAGQTWYRIMLFWLVVYGLMLLYFDPSSSEPWVMVQLPVILLVGPVLLARAGDKIIRWKPFVMLLLFFSINLAGGMLLIRDKTYDYVYLRGHGLEGKVTENDVIITFGPKHMEEYLAYHYPARVVNLEQQYSEGLKMLGEGRMEGNIIVLDDVFHPEKAITHRMNEDTMLPEKIIHENYTLDTLLSRQEFSVYKLRKTNK